MIESISIAQLNRSVDLHKDLYKSELLQMGYFKTSDGRQLYQLTLHELEEIYADQKAKARRAREDES